MGGDCDMTRVYFADRAVKLDTQETQNTKAIELTQREQRIRPWCHTKSKNFWKNFICRFQMPVNAKVVFIGFVSVFPPRCVVALSVVCPAGD